MSDALMNKETNFSENKERNILNKVIKTSISTGFWSIRITP